MARKSINFNIHYRRPALTVHSVMPLRAVDERQPGSRLVTRNINQTGTTSLVADLTTTRVSSSCRLRTY